MRSLITILLTTIATVALAQEVQNPPAGSQGASAVKTPAGEFLLGRTGSWAFVARKEYVDSLHALGYTKMQVDSAITSHLEDYYTADQVDALLAGIPDPPVTSVNGKTGDVTVNASDIGLGNVDNTSDVNKPISAATQSALDGKENSFSKGSLVAGTGVTLDGTLSNRLVGSGNVTINSSNPLTASNGLQINSNVISPVYGTSVNTVAQGNDARILNGNTAYSWGDYRQYGLGTQYGNRVVLSNIQHQVPAGLYATSTSTTGGPLSGLSGSVLIMDSGVSAGGNSFLWLKANNTGIPQGYITHSGIDGEIRPWAELWHTGNLDPTDYVTTSIVGAANGVAGLDGSGKVPSSQLPTGGMQYQGTWNASTNTPTLSNVTGTDGHFYRVTVAGTQNLGSGNITFGVGDDVIHNGTIWQRAPSGSTSTNLALGTRTNTTMPITNSNGNGVTLPVATTTLAGLMSGTDKVKLNDALTSFTESDPTVPSHVKSITTSNISNWNTAYSWGDHASANYFSNNYFVGIQRPASPATNLDEFLPNGGFIESYGGSNWAEDRPSGGGYGGFLKYTRSTDNSSFQIYFNNGHGDTGGRYWFRSKNNAGLTPWYELWHSGNFNPSDITVPWARVTDKPTTFAPSPHSHNASDINAGTLAIARIPTGTTGSTVALGNHTHAASAITSGTFATARIADAAITNAKLANMSANTIKGRASTTGVPQDLTPAQVRAMINVEDGAQANVATNLSIGTRTTTSVPIVSSTGTNATFPAVTTALAGAMTAADKSKLDGIAAGATANATNAQLRDRSTHTGTQAISTVSGLQTALDGKVGTSGNQTISGTKTFSSPVVAPQYQSTSASATSSIPTNTSSLFKASISASTTYTLTNLSGNPRQIQVMVTNTSSNTIYVNFSPTQSIRMSEGSSDNVPAYSTVIFTFLIEGGNVWGVKSTFL